MRVLILDGEHRSALAAVRSLGRKGYDIYVGSELKNTISGVSKYCNERFLYDSPYKVNSKFIQDIKKIITLKKIDILIPMTDASMYRVLQHENELRKAVVIPAVSFEQYMQASNKCDLMQMAHRLNVPYPKTMYFNSAEEAIEKKKEFEYPLVLKPGVSIIEKNGELIHCSVSMIDNEERLEKILLSRPYYQNPFMVQKIISGKGMGMFALCDNGNLKAFCGHRRIREKPPWGGVSVVSESLIPDRVTVKNAMALLKELQWNGIAMVEFKDDIEEKAPKLMEINARFWGSLQLSIDAGIDFPYLLLNLFSNKRIDCYYKIRKTRFRWLMGDFDNLIINFKTGNWKAKASALKTFFLEFISGAKIEDFRYFDFKPFLMELRKYIH